MKTAQVLQMTHVLHQLNFFSIAMLAKLIFTAPMKKLQTKEQNISTTQ
jgi:hypothetical protein